VYSSLPRCWLARRSAGGLAQRVKALTPTPRMMGGPTPPGRAHQDLTASAETEHYLRGDPGTVQALPPAGSVVSESTRPCPSPRDAAGARWAAALAEHEPLVHWVVRRQHLVHDQAT